ncbi:hypothetical protein VTJ49DRAFT_3573 [Mycothermus thermophilus]|uniref:Uncharacterized protein n=1 Tax=Humicola insolens TaxID=85995 RepID=A0ABR3V749_HUMIN
MAQGGIPRPRPDRKPAMPWPDDTERCKQSEAHGPKAQDKPKNPRGRASKRQQYAQCFGGAVKADRTAEEEDEYGEVPENGEVDETQGEPEEDARPPEEVQR